MVLQSELKTTLLGTGERLAMEIDEVFEQIGELGRTQVTILVLLSLPATWMAVHVLAPVFIASDPGWTCSFPPSQPPSVDTSPD